MKLAHFYRTAGDDVTFSRSPTRELFEGDYDLVFGSQIFDFTDRVPQIFLANFPSAILRGTGTKNFQTVEQFLGIGDYEFYDYTDYPGFSSSIGFSERGCRLKCLFCVVPQKEGRVRSV